MTTEQGGAIANRQGNILEQQVLGANIGTSITGWILCLSYIEGSNGIAKILSSATIAAVVAVIGTILRMI